ncbi:ABC transporter ATP-binding protein [Polaromonas sp.]|uniref:ABC transporter ATP-binding protein n=1 Tax=Polaromonas sp. TaxID=1869339 RepID=UPI00286BCA95|nr:ABC transporter ATP-binding protein [Polaromonas sp.]
MADLKLVGVSKSFGATAAVQHLNIEVASGEFIVLLGPSGAGKTTTLRLVAGLEAPDSGRVFIDGRDVTKVAPALRDVTFVFQQYSLYPHLSVYDNLAFPLRSPLRKTSEADIRTKVLEVARMLRMEDKLQNPATKLSGGQMQRVAIGRALVRSPAVYLMDEPLSSLDAKLRNDLRLELKRIQQDLGATMLYVTHDQIEALTLASRIGVLDHGQLVQLGTPQQVYEDPVSVSVASRLGSPRINLLSRAALPELAVPPQVATLGVRAEHVHLRRCDQAGSAHTQVQVKRIERLSDQHLVHVGLAGSEHDLIASALPGHLFEPGETVRMALLQSLWFDSAGQRIRA